MSNLISYAADDFAASAGPASAADGQRAGRRRRCTELKAVCAAHAAGAAAYAAARVARIVLRREPSVAEALAWTSVTAGQPRAVLGRAELALALLARGELDGLDLAERIARAHDAVLDRYDAAPPQDLAHWRRQVEGEGDSVTQLVREHFVRIHDSGYRYDACAAPVDACRPFFAVRDSSGLPLVFSVGANGRLYLFRRAVFGGWSQTDLSAMLPAPSQPHVHSLDIRQAADGSIAVALAIAPRRSPHSCAVYVASGLSNALDEAGWVQAFRAMAPRAGLPEGALVTRLAFGPLLAGAMPLVLLTAQVQGVGHSWTFNAAAAGPLSLLRLPAAQRVRGYAIGSYRLPGVWTMYDGAAGPALAFQSFPDQFGWEIRVAYSGLPRRARSIHLAPGAIPNVPDVFVAGEGIVVYRGGHDVAQAVAPVCGAQLVWSDANAAGEHLAYTDAGDSLWLVSRPAGGAWGQPRAVAGKLVAAALAADPARGGVHAVGITPGGALEWQRLDGDGNVVAVEEIAQSAVWDEAAPQPLRARLDTAA